MRYFNYMFITIIISYLNCKTENNTQNLIVNHSGTALLAVAADPGSRLRSLEKGDKLVELGGVSPFVTPVQFGDTIIEAPWIRVKDDQGTQGWVFAGYLRPSDQPNQLWHLKQKATAFFGPRYGGEILSWKNHFSEQLDQHTLAQIYRKGVGMRDTLTQNLHSRAEPNEAGFSPDFFWLNNLLPGFLVQYVPIQNPPNESLSSALPYWFVDYRFWTEWAKKTNGSADDLFFSACALAYGPDLIESFFPYWSIQTSTTSGSSQLGLGRHLAVLRALEKAYQNSTLFHPEIENLKDTIIQDIVNALGGYWQTDEKILTELNEIISESFEILDETDQIAIKARILQFQDPLANNIPVNLRAGKSD